MLKLTKKGDKYWLFEDSQIGLFSPSKFTINLELNEIVIVYENGLKSKRYNVIDCEIYDLGELSPFTTSSGNLFMQKLEELNCPCFQKNENIYNIFGGGAWGSIIGTLADQTDLQDALDSKLDKVSTSGVERAYIINADGSQGTKATSDFGGGVKTESVTIQNRWTLTSANTYYRSRSDFSGFNDSTVNVSAAASDYAGLTQTARSNSSFFYCANGNKKLDKIYFDLSSAGSTITSYTLMVVACQRTESLVNTSTINGIDLGEYAMTKTSGNTSAFHVITPTDVTIPDGYIVTAYLKRADGTSEVNCSIIFKFKSA